MLCEFEYDTVQSDVVRCINCNWAMHVSSTDSLESIKKTCKSHVSVDKVFNCVHRLEESRKAKCKLCGNRDVEVVVYKCSVKEECSIHAHGIRGSQNKLIPVCISCPSRERPKPVIKVPEMIWSVGITTVPQRLHDGVFERTLNSLKAAGFDQPRLFIDGAKDASAYQQFELETTCHYPNLRTYGNWMLALWELWVREPNADRYAIFQDDFITYKNLRSYLEKVRYPTKSYLNLYTFPSNQQIAPKDRLGFYESNQLGRGAVALVFNQEAVKALLTSQYMVDRPQDRHRGHKSIDGGIVTAFKNAGFKEYVHNPTLVQHIGDVSSMGNNPHPKATSFRGEQYDAMELLESQTVLQFKQPTEEWEIEKVNLENAILDDKARLSRAMAPREKEHFSRLIRDYEIKLRRHHELRN